MEETYQLVSHDVTIRLCTTHLPETFLEPKDKFLSVVEIKFAAKFVVIKNIDRKININKI
jgi:hypothetical protein